jgi:hypothetical protein
MMRSLPDRLPLVIGVTGHRDLREADLPRLEREVQSIIATLQNDYLGGEGETPILVLSALAEGADRLVARVAVAQGAKLIAPLPLPPEEYRRDFEPGLKGGSAAEFDALLGQAIAAPIIPFTPGNSLEAVRADGAKRSEQYRAVGAFIVRHCNVLIAISDGNDKNMAVGGSAEVIKFKCEGIPLAVSGSARASLDASEVGPVVQILAPRQKPGSAVDKVVVPPWGRAVIERHRGGWMRSVVGYARDFVAQLFGAGRKDEVSGLPAAERRELEAWESFEVLATLTREFNREAAALAASPAGQASLAQSREYLFGESDPGSRHPVSPNQVAERHAPRWVRMYTIADTLAQHRQAQFRHDWLMLVGLAFAAFIFFALFSHVGGSRVVFSNVLLAAYSLCFVVLFLVFWHARAGRHQERFLDYRALAEALRVAVFWRLIGIGLRPSDVKADALGHGADVDANTMGVLAHAYPIKQPSELAWVKICLRNLELLDRVEGVAEERALDPACHAIARQAWVHGQCAFFRRRGSRHDALAEFLEAWAVVLLGVPAFVLVPFAILTAGQAGEAASFGPRGILLLVIGLLPGLAAAMTGYSERLALNGQARQYDRMRVLFEHAYELLPENIDPATAPLVRSIYRELGIEAMKENAEWVAVYRQRPIQPLQ